ncbi:TPA: SelB C-terminal domain-containing protein, partial [Burkholderia cenocepacia]
DTLAIVRTGGAARVRSIHAQNRPVEAGRAGERCALNLAGVDKADVERGDTVADARLVATSPRLDVELTLLADAGLTLTHWAPLHVHLGTLHRVAHVALLDGDTLAAGQRMRVQLVFDEPVFALPGDRFIVRNPQATRTVGGGRVLDPFGPARKRRTPARRAWLDALAAWLDEGRLDALLAQAPLGMPRATLTHLTGFAPDALALPDDALAIGQRDAASNEGAVISQAHWRALQVRAVDTLRAYHERMPDEQGLDAARLRRMAAPLVGDALWRALVEALVAGGEVVRSGPWLHLPSHSVSLEPREEALAQQLLPLIHAGRFDPPWVRDLARDTGVAEDAVRTLLRKLARRGDVHQVVRDLFYHADVARELAELVAHLAPSRGGGLDAATFRDATGLGRKRAIQILEFFDRVGYTRFHRDLHYLRPDSGWVGIQA